MLSDNENCSSEDEIYDSDVEQGSKKRKRKAKVADNTKVNSLSPEQIDRWIAELFLDSYHTKKGTNIKGRTGTGPRATTGAHYVLVDTAGEYWFNPEAIPPTYAKPSMAQTERGDAKVLKAYRKWGVLLHCLIWRWAHHYAKIPADKQVSHHTDQPELASPNSFILETGAVNRARVACREQKWYEKSNPRHLGVRACPHVIICKPKLPVPDYKLLTPCLELPKRTSVKLTRISNI